MGGGRRSARRGLGEASTPGAWALWLAAAWMPSARAQARCAQAMQARCAAELSRRRRRLTEPAWAGGKEMREAKVTTGLIYVLYWSLI